MKDGRTQLAGAVLLGIVYLGAYVGRAARRSRGAAPVSDRRPSKRMPTRAGADTFAPPAGDVIVRKAPSTKPKTDLKRPKKYDVLFFNDDYTSQDFVVEMLRRHFNRSAADANRLMLQVHNGGIAVANDRPMARDIAETKQGVVMAEAKKREMPFLVDIQPHY